MFDAFTTGLACFSAHHGENFVSTDFTSGHFRTADRSERAMPNVEGGKLKFFMYE